ncbi:MAG: glycosyltransferase [Fibrobacteria bacterium]|nr:glycosyltransferase [Fibrobacteria bacterium]
MKILSNIKLPNIDGYSVKTFSDYCPEIIIKNKNGNGLAYISLTKIFSIIPKEEFPEILIISSPEYLPVPEDMKLFQGPKILLITDWNVGIRYLESLCGLFDYCFTDICGFELLHKLGVQNIFHQPLFGHNPDRFRFLGSERDIDLSFCGSFNSSLHGKRNQLLYKLARLHNQYRIEVGQFFGSEYVEILNRSKLVFNFSIRSEANMRSFEAMSCGAIPLVEKGNREMPILFREGLHYVEYTPDSLEKVINNILSCPSTLKNMRENALQEISGHSFAAQIKSLLAIVLNRNEYVGNSNKQNPMKELEVSVITHGAILKNNMYGWGYKDNNLVDVLTPYFTQTPELEGEILPAVLLQQIKENFDKGDRLSKLPEIFTRRFIKGEILPGCLRNLFASLYCFWVQDWENCIHYSNHGVEEFERLNSNSEAVFIRKSLYGYLFPPLRLGDRFTVDLNNSFVVDRQSGEYMEICQLLEDICYAKMCRSYLALQRPERAVGMLEKISNATFLSPERDLLEVLTFASLKDGTKTELALNVLFKKEPFRSGLWPDMLWACKQINNKALHQRYLDVFINIARNYLAHDQGLILWLKQLGC